MMEAIKRRSGRKIWTNRISELLNNSQDDLFDISLIVGLKGRIGKAIRTAAKGREGERRIQNRSG